MALMQWDNLRSGFVQLGHVFPVHQIVEPGFEIFRARIAVVDVIGVFPHIHTQQRRAAVHQRVFAIRGLGNGQLAVLEG